MLDSFTVDLSMVGTTITFMLNVTKRALPYLFSRLKMGTASAALQKPSGKLKIVLPLTKARSFSTYQETEYFMLNIPHNNKMRSTAVRTTALASLARL